VAGNRDAATDTESRLQAAGVAGSYTVTDGGFTDFVVNRVADTFLSS
jgi:hypothetical protein